MPLTRSICASKPFLVSGDELKDRNSSSDISMSPYVHDRRSCCLLSCVRRCSCRRTFCSRLDCRRLSEKLMLWFVCRLSARFRLSCARRSSVLPFGVFSAVLSLSLVQRHGCAIRCVGHSLIPSPIRAVLPETARMWHPHASRRPPGCWPPAAVCSGYRSDCRGRGRLAGRTGSPVRAG